MTRLPMHRSSFLQASFFKRLLLPSILLPSLLLGGCVGLEDEADGWVEEEADGWIEGEAGTCKEGAPALVPTLVYDQSQQGLVQSAMTAAGADFATDDYEAVIINVGGSDAAILAPVVTEFLDEGKQVVLDSNGADADRLVIGELAGTVAGLAARETALSIIQDAPGAFTVTPITDTTLEFGSSDHGAGNTPLAVLASKNVAPGSTCPGSSAGAMAAVADPKTADDDFTTSSDTITKTYYKGRNSPVPPIVPSFVDNAATHIQTGSSGSNLKRYTYRGNPQQCPTGGTNFCNMTWGEQYTRSIAHGTKIDVNFSNALTEALTGGVTIGYSLTVTNSKTLLWTNSVNISPGWSARPVSYLWRKTGYGNVKNAYIFQSRRRVHSACRPSGGCYRYYDTYVREPNTVVGSWFADIALNQGDPTNSWNTYSGQTDPNVYVFD